MVYRLTLQIRRGEHTAILGPNGAGKSTFIRLLSLDDYPVANGAAEPPLRLFGREHWNVAELRSRLGIISSDLHNRFVNGEWSFRVRGLEAALSGFFSSQAVFDHHVVTDDMRSKAADALAKVNAAHLAGKRLDEMSTGEARRVLIARALVTTPEVLVLDEPTTGLDIVARHQFMECRQVAREDDDRAIPTCGRDYSEIGRVILLVCVVADDGPQPPFLWGNASGVRSSSSLRDGYYMRQSHRLWGRIYYQHISFRRNVCKALRLRGRSRSGTNINLLYGEILGERRRTARTTHDYIGACRPPARRHH